MTHLFRSTIGIFFLMISLPIHAILAMSKDTTAWGFTLGERSVVSQDMFPQEDQGYFTDGSVPVIKVDAQYYAFWANYRNYRSISNSPFLENHVDQLDPGTPVFGGRQPDDGSSNGFNDGGMWLIGINRLSDGRLAGFFHAESHWYPRGTAGWSAYKSIGVAYSSDNGLSWGSPYQIIKHQQDKPASPAWSGLGDGCVVYNHLSNRYYCFYTPATGSTALSMAASTDPNGFEGSWNKWYNGSFSQPGIGGMESPIANLSSAPGANPSVHWNDYLEKFIMIWHGWDGKLYISSSDNCEIWDVPRLLLEDGPKAWYPCIVGTDSTTGGQTIALYYSYDFTEDGKRTLAKRTITFDKP